MTTDIKQMTVKQLYEETKKLVENGYGDKYIVLSDDVEGNSYHGLYGGFIIDKHSIKRIIDLTDLYDTDVKDSNKLVILG